MSKPAGNYDVGYGRPPLKSQWKKGQCGNPRRKKAQKPKSMKAMIDEYLAGTIWITENGRRRQCTRFEAIFMQILIKALAGRKRATQVLLEYIQFAHEGKGKGVQNIEIVFVPDAAKTKVGGEGEGQ
jgi:hypothetical protein